MSYKVGKILKIAKLIGWGLNGEIINWWSPHWTFWGETFCLKFCISFSDKAQLKGLFIIFFLSHISFQIISYDSPRGGVSVVLDKGEKTTSFLLIQNARPSDSGQYQCNPSNAKSRAVTVHVLNGNDKYKKKINFSIVILTISAKSRGLHCTEIYWATDRKIEIPYGSMSREN